MTLAEIVEEVFEGLGNPSDLEYTSDGTTIDTASDGWLKIVRAINDGCLALATWKFPNGRQVKLRLNEDTGFIVTSSSTQVVVDVEGRNLTLSDTPISGQLIVGRTSGAFGVVGYAAEDVAIMVRQTGVFVVGETVDLYSREFTFPSPNSATNVIDVLQVTDSNGVVLDETAKEESLITATSLTPGNPTNWKRVQKGLRFDLYPDDDLEYFIRYVRGPVTLVNATDVPELPAQMHRGLVLYGQWWGLRRAQESSDAYSVKRDLEDFMARVRIEDDFIISGQVKVYPEGK